MGGGEHLRAQDVQRATTLVATTSCSCCSLIALSQRTVTRRQPQER